MRRLLLWLLILTFNLFAYQGEGRGVSRQEAIYSALSNIASQISVSVDSTTIINKKATNKEYSREVKNMINVEIPKISFQNYHILEESKNGSNYVVKLEIDRKNLANSHIKRLKRRVNSLSQKIGAYSSKLKRYSILKKIDIENLFLSLELVHAIDLEYDTDFFANRIEELEREKNSYIKQLSFQIKSNNSRVREIASNVLSGEDLVISTNGNLILQINLGQMEKNRINKQYIGTTRVVVTIDENHQKIFSKIIRLSSTSFISEHYLLEGIFKQLERELTKTLESI